MAGQKLAQATYRGQAPSIIKEIVYGLALGLAAGGLWKLHHWSNQKRVREFYQLLDQGKISVVVDDDD